jgi:hypothetical protein
MPETTWTIEEVQHYLGWIIVDEDDKTVGIMPSRERAEQILADHARVERLEAALRYYANRSLYFHDHGCCSAICQDEGERARALVGDPDDAGEPAKEDQVDRSNR